MEWWCCVGGGWCGVDAWFMWMPRVRRVWAGWQWLGGLGSVGWGGFGACRCCRALLIMPFLFLVEGQSKAGNCKCCTSLQLQASCFPAREGLSSRRCKPGLGQETQQAAAPRLAWPPPPALPSSLRWPHACAMRHSIHSVPLLPPSSHRASAVCMCACSSVSARAHNDTMAPPRPGHMSGHALSVASSAREHTHAPLDP